jgi:hypothetical protein
VANDAIDPSHTSGVLFIGAFQAVTRKRLYGYH